MPEPDADSALTRCGVARPRGLVLMLHGGRAEGYDVVTAGSASWQRSRWMMWQIRSRLHERDVAVWLLRHQVVGWNAGTSAPPSPVPDARWALDVVRSELGDLPVVLLGHSMGGRTAVAVADHPSVTGVVALAPWWPSEEPVGPLRGRHVAAAHGRRDRITSAVQARAFVQRAATVAASVESHDMGGVGHYMVRQVAQWNGFAASRSLAFVPGAT